VYKTILVPHDGTAAGDEALRHAIGLAKPAGKIVLLHVVEEMQYPPTLALSSRERQKLFKTIADTNESLRKNMETQMRKRLEICNKSEIKAEMQVMIGNTVDEILRIVKDCKVDIIVMAKRRKLKGVKKILSLGSVSRRIVENVTCPILLMDNENPK
jgi:nucleotide-binding universal stress UspA family protein